MGAIFYTVTAAAAACRPCARMIHTAVCMTLHDIATRQMRALELERNDGCAIRPLPNKSCMLWQLPYISYIRGDVATFFRPLI